MVDVFGGVAKLKNNRCCLCAVGGQAAVSRKKQCLSIVVCKLTYTLTHLARTVVPRLRQRRTNQNDVSWSMVALVYCLEWPQTSKSYLLLLFRASNRAAKRNNNGVRWPITSVCSVSIVLMRPPRPLLAALVTRLTAGSHCVHAVGAPTSAAC